MEEVKSDTNTLSQEASSLDSTEIKSHTSPKKTETSPHNRGAIPKTGTRNKAGGVKLGSFRLGGRKKISYSPESSQEIKDSQKASKKIKKGKMKETDKPESEQVEDNSESQGSNVHKHSSPSKTASLVRKLSMGKHKTSGSGKLSKSSEGPSVQEDSPTVLKIDVSTEDDRFSTASSSTSVATGGRPSLEGDEGVVTPTSPSSNPPPIEDVTDTVDQSASSYSIDTKAQQVGEKREHLYKILVIGELGTGKTSIIKRYVHQFFSQHYRATIGVDFALKVLNWDANTIIRLQLWDIAGQERFGNMTRVYYKEAVGAFIVFDVTRTATFEAVVKWKQDLDTKVQLPDGSPIPCVLLANKCDQQKEGLVNNSSKMAEYCRERGFTDWFETSAKENINIEEAARCLVTQILQNDKLIRNSESTKDLEKFALDGRNQRDQKNSKTCAC